MERLVRDHMMDFLIKHKLINPSQHGFLKARSCLTNLLCFFEEITKWVDEGSPVDVIYCITPIFRVEEIFAIFANLDFARNFPPAKIISTANGISRNFPAAKFSSREIFLPRK